MSTEFDLDVISDNETAGSAAKAFAKAKDALFKGTKGGRYLLGFTATQGIIDPVTRKMISRSPTAILEALKASTQAVWVGSTTVYIEKVGLVRVPKLKADNSNKALVDKYVKLSKDGQAPRIGSTTVVAIWPLMKNAETATPKFNDILDEMEFEVKPWRRGGSYFARLQDLHRQTSIVNYDLVATCRKEDMQEFDLQANIRTKDGETLPNVFTLLLKTAAVTEDAAKFAALPEDKQERCKRAAAAVDKVLTMTEDAFALCFSEDLVGKVMSIEDIHARQRAAAAKDGDSGGGGGGGGGGAPVGSVDADAMLADLEA